MAVLSLPLNFNNSFWTQGYRRGLEVLYAKLEQGTAENEEVITLIKARAIAEGALATSLTMPMPTGDEGTGFAADDGASLLMTFRGLQEESVAQGKAHQLMSKELHTLVAEPFEEWADGYKERLAQSRATVLDNWMRSYEHAQVDVAKLKQQYLAKTRKADEAEDDVKFAPNGQVDNYTSSPRLRPADGRAPPQRTASVSERIALRLKELQKKAMAVASDDPNPQPEEKEEEQVIKLDKGKGKATDETPGSPQILDSPPPISPLPEKHAELPPTPQVHVPAPILLAGLAFTATSVSQLLLRASKEMHLRPVRFPLLGEYQDCFTGEEFALWLNENVQGFGGDLDRADDAARDLTQREGLLRRIGELGNQFEHSDEAFFQFRPKAFDIEGKNADSHVPAVPAKPFAENIMKRTGNFANLVSKALNTNTNGEPAYIRARHEAEEADQAYRVAVRKLDRQRLALEDGLEETFKTLQRWETERLRAVKTVLLQYHATLSNLPKMLEPSVERSSTLISAYQPENDLTALIERYRTGPFRPHAHVYESVAHDDSDVVFGIDLRKWAEGDWTAMTTGEEKKELVPPVLTALLSALKASYEKLGSDDEKRKSWIYEVPLPASHHLREALNKLDAHQPIPDGFFDKYDAAVIASTVKLWLLELDPPVSLWEGWDDIRKLYPTVGSTAEKEISQDQHIQDLSAALQKLPRVHLYVLDAVVNHVRELISSTKVEEADEVYVAKLALSVGRTVIRPKVESEISIQDRHPTLLFIDLLKQYDAVLPPTIARKKRESERKVPIRKRTAPIDMRLSRSRISGGADAKQLLAAQQQAQNPSLIRAKSPPLPPTAPPAAIDAVLSPPPPPPIEKPVVQAPPPPPPIPEPSQVAPPPPPPAVSQPVAPPPPPPVVPSVQDPEAPPRPTFKEPPPEVDDLPPRPSFKEPPSEAEDLPPRPAFVESTTEEIHTPGASTFTAPPPPPPVTNVTPPTPQNTNLKRVSATHRSGSPTPNKVASRSPSPPSDGRRASLSRSSSGQSAPVRGPRGARAPRAGGGNVSSIVSNLNRTSISGSPPGNQSSPTPPDAKRLSGGTSPGRRSSVLNRSSAFSRRTMASDAEDDVVDKK